MVQVSTVLSHAEPFLLFLALLAWTITLGMLLLCTITAVVYNTLKIGFQIFNQTHRAPTRCSSGR